MTDMSAATAAPIADDEAVRAAATAVADEGSRDDDWRASALPPKGSHFDVELGLDMVCGSLNVIAALLGETENAPVRHVDLGYMMWLIEEKASAVRAGVKAKIEADRLRWVAAHDALAQAQAQARKG